MFEIWRMFDGICGWFCHCLMGNSQKMVELLSKVMCVVAHFTQKWSLRARTPSNPHTENTHTQVSERANKWTDGRTFRFCSSLGKLIRTNTNARFVQKPAALLKLEANVELVYISMYSSTNSHQYTRNAKTDKRHTKKRSGKRERRSSHVVLYETSSVWIYTLAEWFLIIQKFFN